MTLPSEIKPQDCPEPFWHETHRYCPACSWTENYGKPVKRPITAEIKVPETAMLYEVGDALTLGKGVALALRDYAREGGSLETWSVAAEPYEFEEGTGIRVTVSGLSIDDEIPDPVETADRASSNARQEGDHA
jgi:hypothetical protein